MTGLLTLIQKTKATINKAAGRGSKTEGLRPDGTCEGWGVGYQNTRAVLLAKGKPMSRTFND